MNPEPQWLREHRETRPYQFKVAPDLPSPKMLDDVGFNGHELNDGTHVSPYDQGRVDVGVDNLKISLLQGVDEESFKRVLARTLKATTGISPDEPPAEQDWEEMMKGGLQSALETQTIVFEVTGASRALTHQLVRSRRAGFHQQSQRATWYGDRPNFRMPMSVFRQDTADAEAQETWETNASMGVPAGPYPVSVRKAWERALLACWRAYQMACDAGVSYQDARYILPEGTTNYIICEYTIREFINVFAYRGCSMFLWEMVDCMRKMRSELLAAHPFLEPYVKISCEKGANCSECGGTGRYDLGDLKGLVCTYCKGVGSNRKCTFQGWENVEGVCDFPWARQDNRVFLPNPRNRIGG